MKIKKIASALIACVVMASATITANADASADLYKNTHGGPSLLSKDLEIYKNTGNSYYAKCTYISGGTVTVTGLNNTPDKTLTFTSVKRIDFITTTNESTVKFRVTFAPPANSDAAQANVTIGA